MVTASQDPELKWIRGRNTGVEAAAQRVAHRHPQRNGKKMKEIYEKAGLTEEEARQMSFHIEHGDHFIFTQSYEKLFNYFCDTGEMPYGVAKARTGDPDLWILERLEGFND